MDLATEVSQLVLRERQSRVRGLSAELLACFHEDATVETSWMRGSAQAFAAGGAERTASSGTIINRVGAPAVQVSGQRGFAELYSTTTRWIPVNGVEAVLTSFMRLLYRVEERQGAWKISAMSAVNEGDTLEPAVPGTDLGVDPAALAGLRHSYRFLAYTRSLDGIAVSQDLLGVDRPDEVKALYASVAEWLEGRA
jgi:SnoaL-like protein